MTMIAHATRRLGIDVFTTGQLAAILGVSPRTIACWADSGRLPCYRLPTKTSKPGGLDRRFLRTAVLDFCRTHNLPEPPGLRPACALFVGCSAELVTSLRATLPDDLPTRAVATAFEAGRVLREPLPTVVLIDFQGIGRTAALEIAQGLTGVPITLLCLTNEDEADRERLQAAGFATVLARPVPVSAVAGALRNALI